MKKGTIGNNNIFNKVALKQKYITTDKDLSEYGYYKHSMKNNGAVTWVLKEHKIKLEAKYRKEHRETTLKRMRKYNKNNKKRLQIYNQKYYQSHKIKIKNQVKERSLTKEGKIQAKKRLYKRKQRGFIPLNEPLKKEYDWHHLTKELPFVMAIDRKIHKSCYGKKHYDSVNEQIGLNEIVGKSKEDIEYYIELNYPDEFKIYWFGNY